MQIKEYFTVIKDDWFLFKKRTAWKVLAENEIKQKYRRTFLGPNWMTLTAILQIIAIGPLYASLFGRSIDEYILYISIGIITWNFIVSTTTEYATLIIQSESTIMHGDFDIFTFSIKTIYKNVLIFAHALPVIIFVTLYYNPGIQSFIFMMFGLCLVSMHLFVIGIITSILSTRYRDIPIIIQNIMMLLFFLTPIIWEARSLGGSDSMFIKVNAFFHMVELIRYPLINGSIPWLSVKYTVIFIMVEIPIVILIMKNCRLKIANWL